MVYFSREFGAGEGVYDDIDFDTLSGFETIVYARPVKAETSRNLKKKIRKYTETDDFYFTFFITGYTRSENCVSESRFNELEEIVRVKFEELEKENQELKKKLLDVESKLDFYESQRKEFSADIDTEVETETPDDENSTDIHKRISRDNVSKRESRILKRQQSENVAFYVYLSGKRCYGNHEAFIYDVQVTNVGNGYSTGDGIFAAPVTGVYVFTVTLVPDFHKYVQAEIIVNGAVKGNIFADSQEIHDIHPGSTSIVVHVNAGERVYVRRGTNSNCDVISETVLARTTFAGWLLF